MYKDYASLGLQISIRLYIISIQWTTNIIERSVQIPRLNASRGDQPNAFSSAYVRAVAQFGNMIEVRSGHRTQDLPIFVRMLDKDSKWTFDNGLPTLLTTLLQMNLNGYTFVLPDMVGGNAYNTDVVTKELFIRWLQATTFMPAIQFSAAPWDFDNEVTLEDD